jgi:hypothetical protein
MSATPHRLVRAGAPLALALGELVAYRDLALLLVRREWSVALPEASLAE